MFDDEILGIVQKFGVELDCFQRDLVLQDVPGKRIATANLCQSLA